MAKEQHDREDLLREATGYVRRVEFRIHGREEPMFCGFRECGAASVYWTQGDVLQFNTDNELRRGFWRGRMIASYKHVLTWVDKSEGRVRLQRIPLDDVERSSFVADAKSWLLQIHQAMDGDLAKVLGQVPEGESILSEVKEWISKRNWLDDQREMPCALHPGLGRRQ